MKNSLPKVSIIVPVYKAEAYIHRCIDSLLNQTFQDYEILLIDDGSPDRSGEICDEYAKINSRVRVFHKENGGVSSARQCGIDNALGEYTIHADPDDWVEPNMLEELYAKAKETDADMVICDYYVEYSNKQLYKKQQPSVLDSETVLKELFQQLHGSCWNKLIKRACYKNANVSFDLDLSFCEDLFFNTSLLVHNISIAYVPKAFYHYSVNDNPNSIAKKYNAMMFEYDQMLYQKFHRLLINTSVSDYAKSHVGYLLVVRAFLGNVFTSKEFKIKCYPYRNCILRKQKRKIKTWIHFVFIYLSCFGHYRFMYNFYLIMKRFFLR